MGKVMLSISGKQRHPDGTEEKNTSRCAAEHEILEDGTHRYLYEEKDEETGAVTKSTVTVGPDGITVERKGRFGTNLPFLKDREIDTSYRTPYGTLPIHVATSRVVCLEVNGHINARADYRLTMEGGYDMDCSVMIRTDDY